MKHKRFSSFEEKGLSYLLGTIFYLLRSIEQWKEWRERSILHVIDAKNDMLQLPTVLFCVVHDWILWIDAVCLMCWVFTRIYSIISQLTAFSI